MPLRAFAPLCYCVKVVGSLDKKENWEVESVLVKMHCLEHHLLGVAQSWVFVGELTLFRETLTVEGRWAWHG